VPWSADIAGDAIDLGPPREELRIRPGWVTFLGESEALLGRPGQAGLSVRLMRAQDHIPVWTNAAVELAHRHATDDQVVVDVDAFKELARRKRVSVSQDVFGPHEAMALQHSKVDLLGQVHGISVPHRDNPEGEPIWDPRLTSVITIEASVQSLSKSVAAKGQWVLTELVEESAKIIS